MPEEEFILTVTKPYTYVGTGKKTVAAAGTREQLHRDTECMVVGIKALSSNTGLVFLGDRTVTSGTGYQLSKNETITLEVENLNLLWLDAAVNGEGVSYIYLN